MSRSIKYTISRVANFFFLCGLVGAVTLLPIVVCTNILFFFFFFKPLSDVYETVLSICV